MLDDPKLSFINMQPNSNWWSARYQRGAKTLNLMQLCMGGGFAYLWKWLAAVSSRTTEHVLVCIRRIDRSDERWVKRTHKTTLAQPPSIPLPLPCQNPGMSFRGNALHRLFRYIKHTGKITWKHRGGFRPSRVLRP